MPQTEPKISSGISGAEPSSEGKELPPEAILLEVGAQAQEFFGALSNGQSFPQKIFEKIRDNSELLIREAKARDDAKSESELSQLFWKEISDAREVEGFVLPRDMREALRNEFRNRYIELCISDMNGGGNSQAEKAVADAQLKMWMVGMSSEDTDAIIVEARELSGYDKWLEKQTVREERAPAEVPAAREPAPPNAQETKSKPETKLSRTEQQGEALAELENTWEDFYAAQIRKKKPVEELPGDIQEMEKAALRLGIANDELGVLREQVMRRVGYIDFLKAKEAKKTPALASVPPEMPKRSGGNKNPKLPPWATESILAAEGEVFEDTPAFRKARQKSGEEAIKFTEADALETAAARAKTKQEANAVAQPEAKHEWTPEEKEMLSRVKAGWGKYRAKLVEGLAKKGLALEDIDKVELERGEKEFIRQLWDAAGLNPEYLDEKLIHDIIEGSLKGALTPSNATSPDPYFPEADLRR